MAIDGPLKSVLVVTEDELRVNGGRYLLQSGPAIKVRGYTEDTVGSRRIIHGDAQPVYVLGENDVRANGGRWLLKAGQALRVTDVIGTARGVIQGKAIPVWPVDDDGNYDPDFAGAFTPASIAGLILWLTGDTITGLADGDPVVTWPDQSGSGNDAAQAVAAKRPTYRTGVLNGLPVVRFDGTDDALKVTGITIPTFNTVFFVAKFTLAKPIFAEHSVDASFNDGFYNHGSSGSMMHVRRTGANHAAVGVLNWMGANWGIVIGRYNGTHLTRLNAVDQANGVIVGTARVNTNVTDDYFIASRNEAGVFGDGDIAEFAIYNDPLAVADYQNLESYASTKYGIAI